MIATAAVAEMLGLPTREAAARTPFALISRIEVGLPVSAVEEVARQIAPGDPQFKYRLVPKATYERRKIARLLSSEEGLRLARVARVWRLAVDVWGNEEEARAFLFRPHPMLEDGKPVDLAISNEIGSELVRDVLASLQYGSAA